MNCIHPTRAVIVGLITATLSLLAATPAAFAENVAPGSGSSGSVTTHAAQSGMAGWTIALIVIGAALVVALAGRFLVHFRSSRSVRFATR